MMEITGYQELFATKGIEYLLVIVFLVGFILYWKLLNRPARPMSSLSPAIRPVAARSRWFEVPEGFYCHQGHTWARPAGAGVVGVGVDDFAQCLLGRPTRIALPEVGAEMEQGVRGWQLEFDSKKIDLLSPVDGEVVAVNDEVLRSPDLINRDPYGGGWLMKVRPGKLKANLKNLLSGKLAEAWMGQTVEALRQRTAGNLGIVLQDGGLPLVGIARNLSPEKWDEIAMEFLLTKAADD